MVFLIFRLQLSALEGVSIYEVSYGDLRHENEKISLFECQLVKGIVVVGGLAFKDDLLCLHVVPLGVPDLLLEVQNLGQEELRLMWCPARRRRLIL